MIFELKKKRLENSNFLFFNVSRERTKCGSDFVVARSFSLVSNKYFPCIFSRYITIAIDNSTTIILTEQKRYRTIGLRFPHIIAIVQYFALSLIKKSRKKENSYHYTQKGLNYL